MKRLGVWGTLFLFILLISIGGCASYTGETGNNENAESSGKQPGENFYGNDFPLVVEDFCGRQVEILRQPERIVSLAPSNTELLYALGLAERIVGVTEYCNFPPAALDKPKAGSFSDPYLEQIVALQPDLIVASELLVSGEKLEQLENLHFPILILHPAGIAEVCQALELLGIATGEKEGAALLVAAMQKRLAAVQEKLQPLPDEQRVKVYYEVYADPLMTAGGLSIVHEIIETAGGKNIFADVRAAYPRISPEAVVARDPEIILFPHQHGTGGIFAQEIISRPGWGTIAALQEEKIYGLEADKFSRPGPRLVEAVEELARIFYPELWP